MTQQHSSVIMENVRVLCDKLSNMNEKISSLKNPDGKKTLKYFSNLYSECVSIVISITYYVVENKLAGKKKIYDNLNRAQKILEYLKILDLRYKSISSNSDSKKKPEIWYSYSPLENSEVIKNLKNSLILLPFFFMLYGGWAISSVGRAPDF